MFHLKVKRLILQFLNTNNMYDCLVNTTVFLLVIWTVSFLANLRWRFKKLLFSHSALNIYIHAFPFYLKAPNLFNLKEKHLERYNKSVFIQRIQMFLFPVLMVFTTLLSIYEPTIDYQVEQYGIIGYGTVISNDNNLVSFEITINDKKHTLSCKKCYGKIGDEMVIKFLPEDPNRFIPNYKPQR
jgi:hypothetical protein